MTGDQVLDLAQLAVMTLLYVSAPVMLASLIIGLIIALFQALTSIQEMTLTFVPKIIIVFLSLIFFLPFMSDKLMTFVDEIKTLMIGDAG